MPLYEYKCGSCGVVHTARRHVDDRHRSVRCACGDVAEKIFSIPRVQNLTASADSLQSFGRNLRLEGTESLASKIRRHEAERREAPGAAQRMTEEG